MTPKGLEQAVVEVLGPGGTLEGHIPGFSHRAPQLEMARAVARALEGETHLLVEAGTGTGKTFAYLVPALLSGRRVVVSTGTRVLQDQIFDKDLRALAGALPVEGRVAVLKGRTNYLCLHRYKALGTNMLPAPLVPADLSTLAEWADATETGDQAEVEGLPETHPIWREVTVGADQCLGARCPDFDACFITRAKRRAMAADLIVVNHHLLFADLGVRFGAFGEVIPHYDAVVFDEAHLVEETATTFFGVRLSTFRVRDLVADVSREAASVGAARGDRMDEAARSLVAASGAFFGRLMGSAGAAEGARMPFRPEAMDADLRADANRLTEAVAALVAALAPKEGDPEERHQLARRADALGVDLARVLATPDTLDGAPEADADVMIRWFEARATGASVGCSPLAVGPLLNDHLYSRVRSAIFTSATLTAGGDTTYIRDRLGFAKAGEAPTDDPPLAAADECVVGSPFDYPRQALLYLPGHLPSPKSPAYADAAAEEIAALMEITHGRALLLFTSYRMMESVYERCASRISGRVLKQGEMSRARLLEAFVTETPAVLFATGSFWQGVDVPGEALSCVVIDRLPFAAPDDPVLAARIALLERHGRNAFMEFQVPMAALALKQGVGRLIRSVDDRGVVAVLDHRITRTSYGRVFLNSLPPMARTRERRDVEVFFLKVREAAGG
jgi:ATP-dependent DNA helicase DinG